MCVESALGGDPKQLKKLQVLCLTGAVPALTVTSISFHLLQMEPGVNYTVRL